MDCIKCHMWARKVLSKDLHSNQYGLKCLFQDPCGLQSSWDFMPPHTTPLVFSVTESLWSASDHHGSTSAKRLLSPLKDVPWTVASTQGSFQSLSSTLWSILWPHSHFWLSLKYSEWVLSLTPSVYLTHILLCQLKVENQSWVTYCFSFS